MTFIREHIVKRFTRSKGWRKVRKEFVMLNPVCAVCGRDNNLEVHHIKDFSEHPELELDHNNLITLCGGATKCHFTFGHLGSWKSINPEVVEDSEYFNYKIEHRR